jgi:hypothetical protein
MDIACGSADRRRQRWRLAGKVELRAYYAEGLRRTPELRFEVVGGR